VAFKATCEGITVGMLLWYLQGRIAYYHLGAYSPRGYDLLASFALFSHAIEHFAKTDLQYLDLGGEAGTEDGANSGLSRFKKGWSTGSRMAYLCGRIFDRPTYAEILGSRPSPELNYFPAYRAGELVT
jgi:lipid II:glycine glycyltransferase (peptidoglycan interpeptide bridge formation enzyme)